MKVCVLGRGKVGTALAQGLKRAGCDVVHRKGHPPWRSLDMADVYLLAIPDLALGSVSAALGPLLPRHASVLHCAGARSHEELASLRAYGASIGVLHPLVSFADRRRPPRLAGATFVVQGDPKATTSATRLAKALAAHVLRSQNLGPAYHAAAALVANAGVALACSGHDVLLALGFPRKQAARALSGLLASVAQNIEEVGLPQALTGPVVRGDAHLVAAHLGALRALDPDTATAYASVQPLVLACAKRAGLTAPKARSIEIALKASKRAGPPASKAAARERPAKRQRNT